MKLFPENKLLKRVETGVFIALLVFLSYTVAGFIVLPQILMVTVLFNTDLIHVKNVLPFYTIK